MSDTPFEAAIALPVPLAVFAASLRPRVVDSRSITPRDGPPQLVSVMAQGHPDEVWLHWLGVAHGREKHTPAEWHALIDNYAKQPAHPADVNYDRGA